MHHRKRGGYGSRALIAASAAALTLGATPAAAESLGEIRSAGGPTAIADSYVVVLKGAAPAGLAARYGGTVTHTYTDALRGFSVTMPESSARRLAADPAVAYVAQDHTVTLAAPPASWGLDRIDQRALPLDDAYNPGNTGAGVRAYVLDTGVRVTHSDFGGRAVHGIDTVDDDNDASDCHGHGTHVAGTIGGTAYGVAKGATIVAVRIMNCAGSGQWSDIIAGIDWVAADHDPGELAVANMSISGGKYQALNDAITNAINDGVTFAVAAGNDTADACAKSPASTPDAITAGATDKADKRASFSNFGSCLDLFGPGVGITSAWYTTDTEAKVASGTSMASPHVAGVAALISAANPTFTPRQVRDKMVADATPDVVTDARTGSPNKLLYANAKAASDFAVSVSPESGSTAPGGSVTATVALTTLSGDPQKVSLTATGLPAGATASFDPASVPSDGSSTLSVATTAATAPGSYPVTITAVGSVTHTATFTVTVKGSSDFAVSVSPESGSTEPGGWVATTVSLKNLGGDPQKVRLTASGLPAGATASFDPQGVLSDGSSKLTVATTTGTAPGTYPVTITATGSAATHTATYTLTVKGGNDFAVSVSPEAGSTEPGGSVTAKVTLTTLSGDPQKVSLTATGLPAGATASFDPASVPSDGSSTLSIATTAATAPGTYPVTITATGAVTHTATFTLTVNGSSDFALSVSPASGSTDPGGSVTATVATKTLSGDPQKVRLSATGLPAGVTASFEPDGVMSDGSATLTIATTAATVPGTYPVTVTGTGAEVSHTATFTLTVNGTTPGRDFAVSISPASGSTAAGGSLTATVALKTLSGDPQKVRLSASGLPAGVTAAFDPQGVLSDGSSTLTISTAATAAAGTYPVTVTAASAEVTHTVTYTLTVTTVTPPQDCTGFQVTKTGTLTEGGMAYQPDGAFFLSRVAGKHEACLTGPAAANYDLALLKWTSAGWTVVASSATAGSSERLSYTGTEGYYRYRVQSVSGSGGYTVGYNVP